MRSDWLASFKAKRSKERNVVQLNVAPRYSRTEFDKSLPNSVCATRVELSRQILAAAFAAKYHPPAADDGKKPSEPQGLARADGRTWGRLLNALTDALENAPDTDAEDFFIEVREDGIEFARKILDEWRRPANWCGWIVTLEDALDEAHDAAKANANGAKASEPVAAK